MEMIVYNLRVIIYFSLNDHYSNEIFFYSIAIST